MATQPVASLRTKEYDLLRSLLRELREAAGIGQEALSKKLGRPITYIGKVELGTRRVDLIELMEICAALDQDPSKFVAELKTRSTQGQI